MDAPQFLAKFGYIVKPLGADNLQKLNLQLTIQIKLTAFTTSNG